MRAMVFSAAAGAALLSAPLALADSATPEGARELLQTAAAYFGKAAVEHGVISIAPQGDGYLATIDLQRTVEAYRLPPGVQLTGRWSFSMTPADQGGWKIAADDFPTIAFDRKGGDDAHSISVTASGFHFEGIFDPKLAAFISSAGGANSVDFKIRVDAPAVGAPREQAFHYGAVKFSTTGVPEVDGGVTITVQERVDSLHKSVSGPPATAKDDPSALMASQPYGVGPFTAEGRIDKLRAARLGELWRFLVAHAERRDADPTFPSDLKTRILAALPLWDGIAATGSAHDLTLQTIAGKVALKDVTEAVTTSGLNAQGRLGFAIKIGDLGIDSPLLPAWAAPLTPKAVDLDMTLSADGIDKIVRLAIDSFDAAASPPLSPEIDARMKAMLASGDPKLTVARGHLTSADIDLAFQGVLALVSPKPSGKFRIAADSLDKVLAVVGKAAESNPALQTSMLGLTLMKGLAKTDAAGKMTWEIALDADGEVTVNGTAMPTKK